MKTQISRDTFQPARHYSGVQLQQGRMIVDADWNELSDIARTRLDAALADALASGSPRAGGLALILSGTNVLIRPGRLYVDGVPAALDGPSAGVALNAQPDYPNAPTVPAGDLRFYADVWERSVSALEDPDLMDPGLHGADTATRSQTMLQVKWCATGVDPNNATTNPPLGNAPLSLRLRSIATAGDPCDPCAAEVEVDERIGNYLFRVEVHDVRRSGANTLLTLKWSRDNGAEAYAVGQTPAGFGQGARVWEFFDASTEKQLGNHLTAGFQARRGILSESFTIPAGGSDPKAFVRQWDGYATINLTTNALVAGMDRGATLSAALAAQAHGRVDIAPGTFSANLELLELDLAYAGRSFVPGDYWLATVREAVQASGDLVLDAQPPRGPRHHYLELGQRIGAALQAPPPPAGASAQEVAAWPDAFSRRMHFPPLTDIEAADVQFTEPADCSGLYAGAKNVQEALAQICRIGAEDIGYTLPAPLPPNTVASLLAALIGASWPNLDGQPKNPSVQDMLQALLLRANAGTLPYTVTDCGTTAAPTVRSLLGLTAGASNVGAVLQQLLCNLTGDRLPLNPATLTCPELIASGEKTVQGGLDFLCRTRITSCVVTVPLGQLETILRDFAASDATDLWLCLMPGDHTIGSTLTLSGKRSLRISGVGARWGARVYITQGVLTLAMEEVTLEAISMNCVTASRIVLRANRIAATRCIFVRGTSSPAAQPMVRLEALYMLRVNLFWRDNVMYDTWTKPAGSGTVNVFDPALVANAPVLEAATAIRENPALIDNPAAFEAAAKKLADAIGAMGGAERLAWRDRVTTATAPRSKRRAAAAPAATPRAGRLPATTLLGGQPAIAEVVFGPRTAAELKASFANSIDRINATTPGTTVDVSDLIGTYLLESGLNVALGITSNRVSGVVSGNYMEGDLLLMNGLTSGLDPADVTISGRAGPPPIGGSGDLQLTDNTLHCLRAWLPNGSLVDGVLQAVLPLPGYASVSLTANRLVDADHSVAAAILTMTGNEIMDSGTGSKSIAKLICNRASLTGNVSAAANNAAVITVVGPTMAAAANLVTINRV